MKKQEEPWSQFTINNKLENERVKIVKRNASGIQDGDPDFIDPGPDSIPKKYRFTPGQDHSIEISPENGTKEYYSVDFGYLLNGLYECDATFYHKVGTEERKEGDKGVILRIRNPFSKSEKDADDSLGTMQTDHNVSIGQKEP